MKDTFTELIQKIAHDPSLKISLLYTLSKLEADNLVRFQAMWPTINLTRRQEIVHNMVEIGESNFEVDFTAALTLALTDADETIRAKAMAGLWENDTVAFMQRLLEMLQHDPSNMVKAAAATALGRFIYWSEIEAFDPQQAALAKTSLLAYIHQESEPLELRRRAIEAIAFVSDDQVRRIIEAAYYDEAEPMQVTAIYAMGRSADPRWQSKVLAELDNPSPAIRFEAARACGELELSAAVPKLVALLDDDSDLEVQEMSIWALGRIGGTAAREVLEACLEHEKEAITLAATDALEDLNILGDSMGLLDFDDDDDLFAEAVLEADWDDDETPAFLKSQHRSPYLH